MSPRFAAPVQIFIVLELITGGELFDKIVAEGKFDETKARYYYRQLIKGVKYCHSQGETSGRQSTRLTRAP